MTKRKPACPMVDVAKAAKSARREATRVAGRVAAKHRSELLRAITGLRVLMDDNNRKISERLEAGDHRFDSQDLKIDALDARIDLLARALDALPAAVRAMLVEQTGTLTAMIEERMDRIRTVESQQQTVMRQLKDVGAVNDAIQGFGSIAILLERAEAAVAALERREKASAA